MARGKKKKLGRRLLVLGLIILPLAGLGTGAALRKRDVSIVVQTEKAARRDLTELVTATGKIQPVLQVKISPEVSGEIIELPVKEGQDVKKGDLLVKIKPDFYMASRNSADANYKAAQANLSTSIAQTHKASSEFERNQELFQTRLVSESVFDEFRTALEVAQAQQEAVGHQVEMAAASLRRAEEDLLKCTIYSPLDGTVSKLASEAGERVVGTGMMAGTEIMTVADLGAMEARVEVGEVDVVLVAVGQKARLEVDSFRDRKFSGEVTQIANSAKTMGASTQQEATKFEVRVRIADKERFLPGMSVTAEIETRYGTGVITVPIQSVTTRLPKGAKQPVEKREGGGELDPDERELAEKKAKSGPKPIDVVFGIEAGKAKMIPVKRGISDDSYYEIIEGVDEGEEIVTGSYKAIARELEDGKMVRVEVAEEDAKADELK